MTTPTRLLAARKAAKLAQDVMARRIGISPSLYRELESGRQIPTERVASLLASAFGESVTRLLKPADGKRPPRLRSTVEE